MSDFTANIGAMRSNASMLEQIAGSAVSISEEIGEACNKSGADSESMRAALNSALICGQSVREISTSFKRLSTVLQNCAALYENCEEQILSSSGMISGTSGAATSAKRAASDTGASTGSTSGSAASTEGALSGIASPFAGGAAALFSGDSFPKSGSWEIDKDKPLFDWSYRGAPGKEGTSTFTMGSGDEGGGSKSSSKGKVSAVKPSGTKLYEWDIGAKASGSAAEVSTKIPGGSAKASALKAEAYASGSASLYLTGDDKNKRLAPYASGSIGASVSLLEGSISGKASTTLGPNGENKSGTNGKSGATDEAAAFEKAIGTLGKAEISGKASGTIGKAELSGKAAASLSDKKGKISPRVSGSVSAEAVAAEVSGKVSGTLMGVTATANAGLQAGVGAHASFGISPTAISCDVGASLGLGASIGFTVDISEAVDAVTSSAKALWDYVKPH